ncbi:hypothetical protein SCAR479_00433 [Seiridium cardinale]|uniref:Uncharacterized protein n=1 Tax=Seiridium cardinale TaxID=138064 RepID=A0ABR2Y9G8_9PEZI
MSSPQSVAHHSIPALPYRNNRMKSARPGKSHSTLSVKPSLLAAGLVALPLLAPLIVIIAVISGAVLITSCYVFPFRFGWESHLFTWCDGSISAPPLFQPYAICLRIIPGQINGEGVLVLGS